MNGLLAPWTILKEFWVYKIKKYKNRHFNDQDRPGEADSDRKKSEQDCDEDKNNFIYELFDPNIIRYPYEQTT